MTTIDELFEQLENDREYVDVHDLILVDPVTRAIHIPDTESIFGVTGEVAAERKYFCIPRVVGNNIDVTACSLRVNYTNAAGEDGRFKVSDVQSDGTFVIFSWELSSKVVRAAGDVKFNICVCKKDNDKVLNEWHTAAATGVVLEGMVCNVDENASETDQDSSVVASAVLGNAILNYMILA